MVLLACAGVALLTSGVQAGSTGSDTCSGAIVNMVIPGPVGSPSTTVLTGDLTTATGPDCDVASGDTAAIWWESFELTECGDVVLDLCGSDPLHLPTRGYLYSDCDTSCTVAAFFATQNRQSCVEHNATFTFPGLPPGTYYYPILADPALLNGGVVGTYQINISAQQCSGACCNFDTGSCEDDILSADCDGPNQQFNAQQSCCAVDCVMPGEPFGAFGVELLSNVPLSGFSGFQSFGNDIWGYASPSGREYALIGLASQTAIVEVTDPFNPVVIGQISGTTCTWRDMRTLGTYGYFVNQCSGGMDIVDLTDIDSGQVPLIQRWKGSNFDNAHNIAVNEASGFAYVVSGNLSAGLVAVNLANPTNPSVAGVWPFAGVHDVFVHSYTSGPYAGREIAFCFAPGSGLIILDVTTKSNMFELSRLLYPNLGTTHQGWLTDDERYIIFGDESDESSSGLTSTTYVADVQDLDAPVLVNIYTNGICSIDHNLIIRGDLTYAANYSSGLRVFDTSDVLNIAEVAYFDTFPSSNFVNFVGAWGVYPSLPSGIVLISDIERGLFVLNYDCNVNSIDDTTDISMGTSLDINGNGLPDECEFDCNGNGEPDTFEIAVAPSLDSDSDGILDVCQCVAVAAPQLLAGDVGKSRYLSVDPAGSGSQSALRVTLENVAGFPAANGRTLWVGPPRAFPEEDSTDPLRTFTGAALQCEPYFHDWSTISELQVFGAEITPGSSYQLHAIDASCNSFVDGGFDFGPPLSTVTGKWGDAISPYFVNPGDVQPDFLDVNAIVGKFLGNPNAPIKAAAQMQPNVVMPTLPLSFRDISAVVSSFLGGDFPSGSGITGPCDCPSAVVCSSLSCGANTDCGDGFCLDGFCTDACGRCAP